MLTLSLVCVLVTAKGLRGREVSTAVMTLEPSVTAAAAALSIVVSLFYFLIAVDRVFVSVFFIDPELYAEELDGLILRRNGADEGELRKGVDVHEVVVGFFLTRLVHDV